jgi:two-component system response regulator YesN
MKLQLLIVDDEILFAEGIRSDIHWESLGVSDIFMAHNIRQAKQIFAHHRIDIMLCDIEMPRGSGLELLSWVRTNYPVTESIFLTCHADFKFAQQAIQLGSSDYLLKPVPPAKLEQTLLSVCDKINKRSEMQQYSRYGQFWFQHQPMLIERLWVDILNQTIPSNAEAIRQAAADRNIPFSMEMLFLPVLISLQRYHEPLNKRDEKIFEYALRNSAEEMIVGQKQFGQVAALDDQRLIAILSWEYDTDMVDTEIEQLKQKCESYIASCHRFFNCDISCFIGNKSLVYDLPETVRELRALDRNNVAYDNKVFLLSGQAHSASAVTMPEMAVWAVMLQEGVIEDVYAKVKDYLAQLVRTAGLDAAVLHQFHHDFMQMVYHVMKLKGIQAHQLLSDAASMELSAQATRSVTDMIAWVKHMMARSFRYADTMSVAQSMVQRIKDHIAQQLDDGQLSRETIAGFVYLNPDYLDRTFKKETGMSITEYLVQQRIAMAKELLCKTDLTVSCIASHVGYTNLAHFSKRFKHYSSMNPNQYRQHYSRNDTTEKSKSE